MNRDIEAELQALADLRGEDIDYSDIPPVTDWTGAVRGKFYRPNERHTINIRHADGTVETTHLEPHERAAIRQRLSARAEILESDPMADHQHDTPNDAADHDAEAYVHGTMTVEEQTQTWALVQNLFKWGSLIIASLLLFLTIWFQPGGSFVGGFLAGAVLAAAGWLFLKGGKAAAH